MLKVILDSGYVRTLHSFLNNIINKTLTLADACLAVSAFLRYIRACNIMCIS